MHRYIRANGEALRHLTDQQQNRRPYTNSRIRRNKTDTECTYRHDDNGNSQNFLATIFITQHAEEKNHQEGESEGERRTYPARQSSASWDRHREEHFTKCIGHKAVNTKIEPLHRITERGRCNRFAQFRVVINNGDIAQRDGFYFFLLSIVFLVDSAPSVSQRILQAVNQRSAPCESPLIQA